MTAQPRNPRLTPQQKERIRRQMDAVTSQVVFEEPVVERKNKRRQQRAADADAFFTDLETRIIEHVAETIYPMGQPVFLTQAQYERFKLAGIEHIDDPLWFVVQRKLPMPPRCLFPSCRGQCGRNTPCGATK